MAVRQQRSQNYRIFFIWCLKGISVWEYRAQELDIYDEAAGFFIDSIKEGIQIRELLKNVFLQAYRQKTGSSFSDNVPECATWFPVDDEEIIIQSNNGTGGWLEIENEDERFLKAIIL